MPIQNPYTNQSPYQQNQSKVAASSSVGNNTLKPPQNAFMQGLGNAWNGVSGFIKGITSSPGEGGFNPFNIPTIGSGQGGGVGAGNVAQASTVAPQKTTPDYSNPATNPNMSAFNKSLASNVPQTGTGGSTTDTGTTQADAQAKFNANQSKGLDINGNPIVDISGGIPKTGTGGSTTDTGGSSNQNNTINSLAGGGDVRSQVIASQSNFQTPQETQAYQALQDLKNQAAQAQAGTENVGTGAPITASDQAGQAGILNRLYAAKIANAEQEVANTQVQAGQTQAGQQSVIGATQPQLGQYGQTFYAPPTSAFGGGGVQGGDFQTAMQNYAQMAVNGQLSQIPSAITSNPVLNDQLNQMAKKINPNYNPVLSQASSITQAQGQQIQTYATSANAALDKLSSDFANLPGWQKMGIPGTVAIEQGLGQFFGNAQLSTYQTTLHDARAQLTGVLSTAGGMSPTGAQDTANQYLPDNMTPSQLPAKIAAAKALVAQKVSAFTTSGQQGGGTAGGSGGGNIYNF